MDNKRMTLDSFRQWLATSTPSELSEVDISRLPVFLPVTILDEVGEEKRAILENLMMALNAHGLEIRADLLKEIGSDALNAVDFAEQTQNLSSMFDFRAGVIRLKKLFDEVKANKMLLQRSDYWPILRQLVPQLSDVRRDYAQISGAIQVIDDAKVERIDLQTYLSQAREVLVQSRQDIDKWIAAFLVMRLILTLREMSSLRKKIEKTRVDRQAILKKISEMNAELEKYTGFFVRTMKKNELMAKRAIIQKQLAALTPELEQVILEIPEESLIEWMDTVVDVNLHPQARTQSEQELTRARPLLYAMLAGYCENQESSAQKIAENPFMVSEPETLIRYAIKSESFILKYFANKREQASTWLSTYADQYMNELRKAEQDLLGELKKNIKRHGLN